MLSSCSVRWGAGAAQICLRVSAAPPLLCNADPTNVAWLASALLALLLAGAAVLLRRDPYATSRAARVLAQPWSGSCPSWQAGSCRRPCPSCPASARIAGGLLLLVAHGAGPLSLDRRRVR